MLTVMQLTFTPIAFCIQYLLFSLYGYFRRSLRLLFDYSCRRDLKTFARYLDASKGNHISDDPRIYFCFVFILTFAEMKRGKLYVFTRYCLSIFIDFSRNLRDWKDVPSIRQKYRTNNKSDLIYFYFSIREGKQHFVRETLFSIWTTFGRLNIWNRTGGSLVCVDVWDCFW